MKRNMIRGALLATLLGLTGPASAAEKAPIIDMHLHAYTVDRPYKQEPLSGLHAPYSSSVLQQQTLAALEQHQVVLAVTDGAELESYRREAPEKIVPGCGIRGIEDIAELRQRLQGGECWLLTESRPQRMGITINSPRMAPYFDLAEELGVPVGVHMGVLPTEAVRRATLPDRQLALNDPASLREVLKRHPDLRLYVTHAGWPMQEQMIALLEEFPQVYVDIGGINWMLPREVFHQYLRELVEAGYTDRIMFGSDQMRWPDAIGLAIEAVESASFLSQEQKRKIFYSNGARFLQLDREMIAGHYGQ